jgi:hypothetical protein
LNGLSQAIRNEVLKIPKIITSGAVRLQNDFDIVSDDLENNVNKLKEKLATAQTDEERETAMSGLVVLNKLQAVQQGVSDVDAELRKKIGQNAYNGVISSNNVDGAMTSVLAAMNTLNNEMGTVHGTVDADTQTIGQQTASLVNGMNVMINSTADKLAQQAAQAAVESRFNLNMVEARNKVRASNAVGMVTKSLDKFNQDNTNAFEDESNIRSNLDSLSGATRNSSLGLSARIDSVLDQVLESTERIKNGAVKSEGDVLTRLALVRISMMQFLGLWNEYVQTMEGKFSKFNANDDEFIQHLEAQLVSRLTLAEGTFKDSNAKVGLLKQELDSVNKAQDEFESAFNGKASDIRGVLRDLNAIQASTSADGNKQINALITFQGEMNSQTRETAKKLLDEFDNAVTNRVSQVTNVDSPQTEFSFLEREIQDLDKSVEEYE